jgi:hydroxymethylpyrimidine/phosphomethylpyrimidine kinase
MAILQLMSGSPTATEILSVEDMETAAKGIYALGPAYVLLKGGHLAPSNTTGQHQHVYH